MVPHPICAYPTAAASTALPVASAVEQKGRELATARASLAYQTEKGLGRLYLLHHRDSVAAMSQSCCQGSSADASANDDDVLLARGVCHQSLSWSGVSRKKKAVGACVLASLGTSPNAVRALRRARATFPLFGHWTLNS